MTGARTAHVVRAGGYLPPTPSGRTRRVGAGHTGVYCDACEWAVVVPSRFGSGYVERLRVQHLGTAHLSELGRSIVINPELRHVVGGEQWR